MKYAKPIGILSLILIGVYTAFGMDKEPTIEERIAQEVATQNAAIDKQNDLLTEKYQNDMIQCTTSASGSYTEVLSQLESCPKLEKPKLQSRVGGSADNSGYIQQPMKVV